MKKITFRLRRIEYLFKDITVLVPDDTDEDQLSELADDLYSSAEFCSDDISHAEAGDHSWEEDDESEPEYVLSPQGELTPWQKAGGVGFLEAVDETEQP